MSNKSIIEDLSDERKLMQEEGTAPDWITTISWQMMKGNVVMEGDTIKNRYRVIAKTAASHMPRNKKDWENKFFDLLWSGDMAASSPVATNMGTEKGCPVSCSGGYIGDSIHEFYTAQVEAAMLSKNGFGTSGYLGDIRERGSVVGSTGAKASGILPVFKDFVQVSRDVSQGGSRRGAWAGYMPIEHGDFHEIVNYITNNPDDANIGWNISDKFVKRLNASDPDAVERFQKALHLKMISGKGYFFFVDKANRLAPDIYKKLDLKILASNLCSEIALFSGWFEGLLYTFTCVLSSMNLTRFDIWKNTDAVFNATVFLDCVASEFIKIAKDIAGIEASVRFTEASRALGLGALGFHSYLQQKNIPFESMDAYFKNTEIFKYLDSESRRASEWMAEELGEPKWMEGTGKRNSHLLSIAPNLTSAVVCGSKSQGIEPFYKNVFAQGSASGELERINPSLLILMKERGKNTEQVIDDIIQHSGSVQHVDWLDDHEKLVFKTAFEIDQKVIIRLASTRQRYIDQAQSINLFFSADEDEEYIAEVHQMAFEDPYIKSLYYIRSESGVMASKGECVACEG